MKISKHKLYLGILDALVFNGAFILAYYLNFSSGLRNIISDFPVEYLPSTILFSMLIPILFQLQNLYKYQMITDRAGQAIRILKGYLQALALFIIFTFVVRTGYVVQSRVTVGLAFLVGFSFTLLVRCYLTRWVYLRLVRAGKLGKRALIIGAGEEAKQLQKDLDSSKDSYFHIVGFCDSDPSRVGQRIGGYLILGTTDEIAQVTRRYKVEEILIAVPDRDHVPILKIIDWCKDSGAVIHVISSLYEVVTEKLEAEVFGNLRTFRIAALHNGIITDVLKRFSDVAGSLLLLVILFPFFAILSILIKLDSAGPVFYKRRVVGKDGKEFVFYKFRTMHANNDESFHKSFMKDFIEGNAEGENTFYVKNDPRITRVGKYLRKYSIDEFPQLINVFLGNMSLVGPRPANTDEVRHYKEWHRKRFAVKPGMTGLWQVRARSAVKYDDMVAIDLYYIENRSLWLDFEILLQTIPTVLFGRGSRV